MNILVDLILVLIVLFCAWYGHRKGLILSFFNFFGGLISFFLGSFLARPLGTYISDSILKPFMTDSISKAFREFLAERASEAGGEVLPSAVDFFRGYGLDQPSLQSFFQNAENNVDEFIESSASAVANPLSESLGFGIALIVLFVIFFFLFRYVVKVFDLVAKLPFLNFANRSLGFLFGISYGILLSTVFSAVLVVAEPLLVNSDVPLLASLSIEETYVSKYLSAVLKLFF